MMVLVMGVSGSGKTSLGQAIAARLGAPFLDGDDFHPPANVEKMAAGIALTDEDRAPWLDALGRAAAETADRSGAVVVACSALKRDYRDRLRRASPDLMLVYIDGDPALIGERMAHRPGHFMPTSLLGSQMATLEPPGSDEHPIVAPAAMTPAHQLELVCAALNARGADIEVGR